MNVTCSNSICSLFEAYDWLHRDFLHENKQQQWSSSGITGDLKQRKQVTWRLPKFWSLNHQILSRCLIVIHIYIVFSRTYHVIIKLSILAQHHQSLLCKVDALFCFSNIQLQNVTDMFFIYPGVGSFPRTGNTKNWCARKLSCQPSCRQTISSCGIEETY